ncbi:uncharacterized protein LOC127841320 isoform X2 [Dreissena polymorpha]|uniref:C2H2-type domain-containing protein n=2 Tax=Dreissena polymorpha TaxID=45954 RepID=A0A9D4IUT3_DREPO|nr:uncharacterized protein LOC127841320 isoform X2 [Dreissena polymorpha]XP_052225996.1 uncharacterized protein LOC127841320 isoform X2 [Dreissena polymorpha]XP_052225997.1 uncharacterized protein LOC127841320 isoform X2 [Dreissena polymorpha]KAH3787535.1 hypothetical protein DPMN_165659 [Dreissena polymorpha]
MSSTPRGKLCTRTIEEYVKTGFIKEKENGKRNAIRQTGQLFRIVNGELYRYGTEREFALYGLRIVIHDDEEEKKQEIVAKCHVDDMGNHFGTSTTQKNISDTYYWMGITASVQNFVKTCDVCKVRSKDFARDMLPEGLKKANKPGSHLPCKEAKQEIQKLGRIKKPSPPETFFIVNTERKILPGKEAEGEDEMVTIDSNNIEFVVETLGHSEEGEVLPEVCHVLNVPDIVPTPERFRSREIENFLKFGRFPEEFTINQKNGLKNPASQYTIIDDELYHDSNKSGTKGLRLVIHDDQPALKVKIIVENHIDEDGSHNGLNKTMTKISEKYFWSGLSIDCKKFMMHCKLCHSNRSKKSVKQVSEEEKVMLEKQAEIQKTKHNQKMAIAREQKRNRLRVNEQRDQFVHFGSLQIDESASHLEEVQSIPVDSENENDGHETYNQVIRLVGPNDEVTEYTVALPKGTGNPSTIQLESGEIIHLGGVEMGEIIENNVEGTNNAEETTEESDRSSETVQSGLVETMLSEEIIIPGLDQTQNTEALQRNDEEELENENGDDISVPKLIIKQDPESAEKGENGDDSEPQAIETEADVDENEEKTGEAETEEDELLEVMIINSDGKKEHKILRKSELKALYGDIEIERLEDIDEETAIANVTKKINTNSVSKAGLFSYYNDIIFVPKMKLTRAIAYYLETGMPLEGFHSGKLKEYMANYYLEDGVLYRRPSVYKTGVAVVHDDNPEIKLKLIEESHKKPNGAHCSSGVTLSKLAFRYYWEEMSWDVHRYYLTCSLCVINGMDTKTNKPIRTVEEEKLLQSNKRRSKLSSGRIAQMSRDFRNRNQHKFDKFKQWERLGKSNVDETEDYSRDTVKVLEIPEYSSSATELRENIDGTVEMLLALQGQGKAQEGVTYIVRSEDGQEMYKVETSGQVDQDQIVVIENVESPLSSSMEDSADGTVSPLQQVQSENTEQNEITEQLQNTERTDDTKNTEQIEITGSQEDVKKVIDSEDSDVEVAIPDSDDDDTAVSRPKYPMPEVINVVRLVETSGKTTVKSLQGRVITEPRKPAILRQSVNNKPIKEQGRQATKRPVSKVTEESSPDPTPGRRSRREIKRPRRFSPESEVRKPTMAIMSEHLYSNIDEAIGTAMEELGTDLKAQSVDDGHTSEEMDADDMSDDDGDDSDSEDQTSLEILLTEGIEKMSVIKSDSGFSCSLCNSKFTTERQCLAHGTKNQCYDDCELCGKMYKKSQLEEYMKHVARHEKGKKFTCSTCKKMFFESQHLQMHTRLHRKPKGCGCNVCGEEFYTSFQLAAHRYRAHKKADSFNCDVCGAKFVNVKFMRVEPKFDGELSYFKCFICSE